MLWVFGHEFDVCEGELRKITLKTWFGVLSGKSQNCTLKALV